MPAYAKNYGYFFNSNIGDRTYNAESFEEWLKPFFISGVFNGEMQVLAQSTPDMTVIVKAGHANLNGKAATWDTDNTMTLAVASGVYGRIDTIVLRRDNINRQILIDVVTGSASANPQPTAPVRDADTFELVLAQIYVGVGVTAITQANITDKRMDLDVCGYVAATVDQIDFDQIYEQYEQWQEDTQDYFTAWFESIRGQLDEDAAGHLQNEIDDINTNLTTNYVPISNIVDDLTSTATNKPLSANQGYLLKSNIATIASNDNYTQSIVLANNASTTAAQFSTYSGRKFSDYRSLVFVLYESKTATSIIRESVTIPTSMWTTGKSVYLVQNHGGTSLSSVSGVVISYNSDTSVNAIANGAGALVGFEIQGYMKS
jgi:hypothetical protein